MLCIINFPQDTSIHWDWTATCGQWNAPSSTLLSTLFPTHYHPESDAFHFYCTFVILRVLTALQKIVKTWALTWYKLHARLKVEQNWRRMYRTVLWYYSVHLRQNACIREMYIYDNIVIYYYIYTPRTKRTNTRCINQKPIKVTHTQKEHARKQSKIYDTIRHCIGLFNVQ